MKEEIKEIELDHFNNINELIQNVETWIKEDEMYWERWFSLYDLKTLLDYITNLQEEVNKLTAESTEWESKCYDLQEENEILTNARYSLDRVELEKRIDKAIEYILEGRYGEEDDYESISLYIPKLLNILKGDKDE